MIILKHEVSIELQDFLEFHLVRVPDLFHTLLLHIIRVLFNY